MLTWLWKAPNIFAIQCIFLAKWRYEVGTSLSVCQDKTILIALLIAIKSRLARNSSSIAANKNKKIVGTMTHSNNNNKLHSSFIGSTLSQENSHIHHTHIIMLPFLMH
jgi:hypothetical protein